ncbi:hypothetical protein BKN38_09125 [Helicobacter sp. CLO-3]|uniref:hypothetical protein n=1 Tax=unclassified Helicobacter TaxID=2593540 RepID=UPI0008055E05|nr:MULTISPECIES: hypothetical protein [unclassified Helicobacter]OBV29966.1 hypothetical protein BA723_09945 [Helicobacter sp. CLO-3]OHU81384.1 hypothetical protein BKN38_09125 [Helicobacter sp. CLO-3]
MRVFVSFALVLALCFGTIYAKNANNTESIPDANDFFAIYKEGIASFHQNIKRCNNEGKYIILNGFSLVDYRVYKALSPKALRAIRNPLIFFHGNLAGAPIYSEFGGISIKVEPSDAEKGEKTYLSFQGRYLSDLQTIGERGEFYALCLPKMQHCLLIGIGEKW